MRIYVELPNGLDVSEWGHRNAQGIVPDATPYGLHYLAVGADEVVFRESVWSESGRSRARLVDGRTWGWQFTRECAGRWSRARREADVVLCMDERTGGPAALLGGPPVVTGVGWLERTSDLPRPQRLLARAALHRAAAVFTQCPALAPLLTSEFGVDPARVHTVRMGIDTAHFDQRPWPERPGTVFSVGDDRMRDHPTLVRAIESTRRRGVASTLHLATTLPIAVPAEVGRVSRRRMDQHVRECYEQAEVVAVALHPTSQGSGLTVALEAMASGRPVVITGNPGLDTYVEDGRTGYLVPSGDAEAMAEAVTDLLNNPDRARRMGAAARARVEDRFTTQHMAHDLRRVLKAACTVA